MNTGPWVKKPGTQTVCTTKKIHCKCEEYTSRRKYRKNLFWANYAIVKDKLYREQLQKKDAC